MLSTGSFDIHCFPAAVALPIAQASDVTQCCCGSFKLFHLNKTRPVLFRRELDVIHPTLITLWQSLMCVKPCHSTVHYTSELGPKIVLILGLLSAEWQTHHAGSHRATRSQRVVFAITRTCKAGGCTSTVRRVACGVSSVNGIALGEPNLCQHGRYAFVHLNCEHALRTRLF